ncbi:MAG: serine/threonine-protein kinase [Myxococcales bacterium]
MPACAQCGAALEGSPRFCPACGEAAEPRADTAVSADPYVGQRFADKFRVDELLGEGGMGRVYRAVQLSLDKVICLKVLRRELASDPETQARFRREAKAASRLNHPNSIQIIDFGAGRDGELYIAMELVAGQDLQQLMQSEFPLDERRVRHIMAQVLDALSEAHAQKIIHRDLKPENIMVGHFRGDPDFVKVLDFGIAQIQDGSAARLTRAGLVCGTPEYMSPEQARGEDLDPRSDLYSAGVILYQMAVGRLPFQADTPMGVVTKHLTERPKPPAELRPDVSPSLNALILRALSKERGGRARDALTMRDELLAGAGGKPSAAPAPVPADVPEASRTAPTQVKVAAVAPGSRRAGAAIWVPVGVAALAAAGVAAWRFRPVPAPPARTASASPNPGTAPSPAPPAQTIFQRYLSEGNRALQAQDLDQALQAFERAARADPAQPEPYKRIGLLWQMKGDAKKAAANLQHYVDSVPTPPDAENIEKIIAALK